MLCASHSTEGLREASWPDGIAGFALSDRRVRSIAARPTRRDHGDRSQDRIGDIRCDGAEVPSSSGPNRQARPSPDFKDEADRQIPVCGAGQRDGRRCSTSRSTSTIGTQPSTANAARLRASLGCSRPENPAGQAWTGFSVRARRRHSVSTGERARRGRGDGGDNAAQIRRSWITRQNQRKISALYHAGRDGGCGAGPVFIVGKRLPRPGPRAAGGSSSRRKRFRALSSRPPRSCRARSSARTKPSALPSASSSPLP